MNQRFSHGVSEAIRCSKIVRIRTPPELSLRNHLNLKGNFGCSESNTKIAGVVSYPAGVSRFLCGPCLPKFLGAFKHLAQVFVSILETQLQLISKCLVYHVLYLHFFSKVNVVLEVMDQLGIHPKRFIDEAHLVIKCDIGKCTSQ